MASEVIIVGSKKNSSSGSSNGHDDRRREQELEEEGILVRENMIREVFTTHNQSHDGSRGLTMTTKMAATTSASCGGTTRRRRRGRTSRIGLSSTTTITTTTSFLSKLILTITTTTFLLLLLSTTNNGVVEAAKEYRSSSKTSETINAPIPPFSHTNSTYILPTPLSESSATSTIAPNDEGDIQVLVYIIGGCADETRRPPSPDAGAGTGTAGSGGLILLPCENVSAQVYSFDPVLDTLAKRKEMFNGIGRYGHEAIVVDGNIWIVGGRDSYGRIVRDVDMYNPAHDTWTRIGQLPPEYSTTHMTAWVYGEDLYVAGGYQINPTTNLPHPLSITYKIDTVTSMGNEDGITGIMDGGGINDQSLALTRLADMIIPRGGTGDAVPYGHYAFVAGGYDDAGSGTTSEGGEQQCRQPLSSVERYDAKKNVWTMSADMSTGRGETGFIKFNGRLLALWGDTFPTNCNNDQQQPLLLEPIPTIETYDPLQGQEALWTLVPKRKQPESPEGRMKFASIAWPATSSVILFGGMVRDEQGCDGTGGCYKALDSISVYTATTLQVKSHFWLYIVGILSVLILIMTLLALWVNGKRRRRRMRRDIYLGGGGGGGGSKGSGSGSVSSPYSDLRLNEEEDIGMIDRSGGSGGAMGGVDGGVGVGGGVASGYSSSGGDAEAAPRKKKKKKKKKGGSSSSQGVIGGGGDVTPRDDHPVLL